MKGGVLGGEFAENIESLAQSLRVVILLHLVQDRINAILVRFHITIMNERSAIII